MPEKSTELIAGPLNGGVFIALVTTSVNVFVSVVDIVEVTILVTLTRFVTVEVQAKVVAGMPRLFVPDAGTIEVEMTVTFRTEFHHGV